MGRKQLGGEGGRRRFAFMSSIVSAPEGLNNPHTAVIEEAADGRFRYIEIIIGAPVCVLLSNRRLKNSWWKKKILLLEVWCQCSA